MDAQTNTCAAIFACLLVSLPSHLHADSYRAPGLTAPDADAILSAVVAGAISHISIKEGDTVEKDQLLVELDHSAESLEVRRRKLIAESKIELEAARKNLVMTETELASTRQLYERTKSVAKEVLDKQVLDAEMAAAEVAALALIEEREQLDYELALTQRERRDIRAPWDGVVSRIFLELGESCEPRQPLVRLVNTSKVDFNCSLDAKRAARMTQGQDAQLEIDTGTKMLTITGTVTFISPVVDAASGLREVRVTFDNPDGQVAPGVAGMLVLHDD